MNEQSTPQSSLKPTRSRNFITDYVSLSQGTEIPDIFALWCAVAGVSCALGRRTWLDMGTFTIYPNFYIVLVGGSGRVRKSTAISQIEGVLRTMSPPPNLISQKITPEALLEALSGVNTTDAKILLKKNSTGFLVADELNMFLNRKSYESGLAGILIQLYDCKEVVAYHTKGRGVETVNDSCFGILSGSTVDWIRNAIPEDAVGGGLTSRFIFVYVQDPCPPVAFPSFSDEKRAIKENLVRQLQVIATLEGQFKLDEEAKKFFSKEYIRFATSSEFFDDKNLSGYGSRRGVHLLKIAMVFAAAEQSLLITLSHVTGAVQMLESAERHLTQVLTLITASEAGTLVTSILDYIRQRKKITRTNLLKSFNHKIGSRELTEIIDTLKESGQVECGTDGKDTIYTYKK